MPRPRARTHPRTPVQPHPRTDMPAPFAVLQRVLACLRAPWHVSLHVTHERARRRGFAATARVAICGNERARNLRVLHYEASNVHGARTHRMWGRARDKPCFAKQGTWTSPTCAAWCRPRDASSTSTAPLVPAPATSAPGLGSPRPHLHRSDWAHLAHIRSGRAQPAQISNWTGLTPHPSVPRLTGLTPPANTQRLG